MVMFLKCVPTCVRVFTGVCLAQGSATFTIKRAILSLQNLFEPCVFVCVFTSIYTYYRKKRLNTPGCHPAFALGQLVEAPADP